MEGYCYCVKNQNVAYAAFCEGSCGKSFVCYNGKMIENYNGDFVCGLKLHKSDLYIIYQRAVLRVRNVENGNLLPEDSFTLSMLDYYSYENPQLIDFHEEKLFASIGGRFFLSDSKNDQWIEQAQFFIGSSEAEITKEGLLVFSVNLLRDNDLYGVKIFNPETCEINFFPIDKKYGKSPSPKTYFLT